MEHSEQKVAVMGFGNPVRSDDAVGVYVLKELQQKEDRFPHVTFFDMGTGAFEVLFKLQGHSRIVIIDAVLNSGEPDGTLFKLPATEIDAAIQEDPLVFLHSIKWDQGLSYARKIMGENFPDDITVYLIAISNTRLEIDMSEAVQQAGDRLVNILDKDLKEAERV